MDRSFTRLTASDLNDLLVIADRVAERAAAAAADAAAVAASLRLALGAGESLQAAAGAPCAALAAPVAPRQTDPVEYWVGIPEEKWRADTVDVGPPDEKLWLTVKGTQKLLGRSETTVRALVRDYAIGLMYGGQWVVNRHRAIAAAYGRLPKKAGN